jgi:hypothetical protein
MVANDPAKQRDGAAYGRAILAIALMKELDNSAQLVGTHAAASLTGGWCLCIQRSDQALVAFASF